MISRALLPAVLAAAVPASALLLDVNSPLVPGITAIPGYSALASLVATTTVSAPGAMATPGIDSLTGVSVACLTSLAGLIPASPDQPGLCLGINQAIGIFGANVAQQGTSLVQPVKKYLDQVICSQDSCTANVIQNAREKLANDCSDADLALSKGVNIPNAVKYLADNYAALRTASCFKDKSSGDYCVIRTLDAVEKSTGKALSINELQSVLTDGAARADVLKQLEGDKASFCTECNKALYTQLSATDLQGVSNTSMVSDEIRSAIRDTCGNTYLDGVYPGSIINATKEALALNGGAIAGAAAALSSSSGVPSTTATTSATGAQPTTQTQTSGRPDGAASLKASGLAAAAVAFGVALLF